MLIVFVNFSRFLGSETPKFSRMSVKFGKAEGICGPLRRAKFHPIRESCRWAKNLKIAY